MSYPISEDKKLQKLSNLLTRYGDSEGLEFSFSGEEIYNLETFAHWGGLSLFLIEAKEIYEQIYNNLYTVEELMSEMGIKIKKLNEEEIKTEQDYLQKQPADYQFPINFREKPEETYFGFIPEFSNELPVDFMVISHFTVHAVEQYAKIYKKNKMLLIDGKIPLDPLYEKMINKINSNVMQIKPATPSNNLNYNDNS